MDGFLILQPLKIIQSPSGFSPRKKAQSFQLFEAIVMDRIWFTTNPAVHSSKTVNIHAIMKHINLTFKLHNQA